MRDMRFVARVLLTPIFLYGGWDVLRHPEGPDEVAKAAGTPDADVVVRANATAMVGAGTLLLLGIIPRLAATVLAALLIPTTLGAHQFWKKQDPERKRQLTHFLKNLSTIGGLLMVAAE